MRLPVGLFLADEAHRRAGLGRHAPEAARSPDVAAVGDEDELLAVRRPRRREVLVELRVVVAGQPAVAVLGQADGFPGRRSPRHGEHEDVPAALERRRDVGDARTVRRPARVEVHGAVGHEGARLAVAQIQDPELQRVVAVGRVENPRPVRRPVRLGVVAGPVGQLDRLLRAESLAPERPLHRVDELLPVGRPRRGARVRWSPAAGTSPGSSRGAARRSASGRAGAAPERAEARRRRRQRAAQWPMNEARLVARRHSGTMRRAKSTRGPPRHSRGIGNLLPPKPYANTCVSNGRFWASPWQLRSRR